MITQLVLDTIGEQPATGLLLAGLPVEFLDFAPLDKLHIKLPGGSVTVVDAAAVGSGRNGPEATLKELEKTTGVSQRVLCRIASDEGKLMARKSAGTWLSTVRAVEYAIEQGYIRAPKKK